MTVNEIRAEEIERARLEQASRDEDWRRKHPNHKPRQYWAARKKYRTINARKRK